MSREQGIYDISNEEYHAGEGISRSGIMSFKKTAFHYWNEYLNPERPSREKGTDATNLGNAFHTLMLEPTEFNKRYIVKLARTEKIEKVPLLRDVGREAYDEAKRVYELAKAKQDQADADFVFSSMGKECLSEATYQILLDMKARLDENPTAKSLIEGAQYEKSIFWNDPHTNLLCKCRPDIMHSNMIVDLKSAVDASAREFQRSLYGYGYHIQAGMIHEGLKHALGLDIREFIFIAQEKVYPYAHAIYKLDDLALDQGISEFKNKLLEIKYCYEKNEWPSYPTQIITLPAYATIGV